MIKRDKKEIEKIIKKLVKRRPWFGILYQTDKSEISKIVNRIYDIGHKEGWDDGFEAGFDEGYGDAKDECEMGE